MGPEGSSGEDAGCPGSCGLGLRLSSHRLGCGGAPRRSPDRPRAPAGARRGQASRAGPRGGVLRPRGPVRRPGRPGQLRSRGRAQQHAQHGDAPGGERRPGDRDRFPGRRRGLVVLHGELGGSHPRRPSDRLLHGAGQRRQQRAAPLSQQREHARRVRSGRRHLQRRGLQHRRGGDPDRGDLLPAGEALRGGEPAAALLPPLPAHERRSHGRERAQRRRRHRQPHPIVRVGERCAQLGHRRRHLLDRAGRRRHRVPEPRHGSRAQQPPQRGRLGRTPWFRVLRRHGEPDPGRRRFRHSRQRQSPVRGAVHDGEVRGDLLHHGRLRLRRGLGHHDLPSGRQRAPRCPHRRQLPDLLQRGSQPCHRTLERGGDQLHDLRARGPAHRGSQRLHRARSRGDVGRGCGAAVARRQPELVVHRRGSLRPGRPGPDGPRARRRGRRPHRVLQRDEGHDLSAGARLPPGLVQGGACRRDVDPAPAGRRQPHQGRHPHLLELDHLRAGAAGLRGEPGHGVLQRFRDGGRRVHALGDTG